MAHYSNDGVVTRGNARKAGLEDMKVFLLEFEATNYGGPPTFTWSGKSFGYEDWLEIVVEPGSNASIFRNLYADGTPHGRSCQR